MLNYLRVKKGETCCGQDFQRRRRKTSYGEICEYVTAFRRLVTSADTRTVRNPNARSVWVFDENGLPHEIKGGTQVFFE